MKGSPQSVWVITYTLIRTCCNNYCIFLAHLSIEEDPEHHQNVVSSSFYQLHKISLQSIHNFFE